jgi:type VI protein secretion system component VasA
MDPRLLRLYEAELAFVLEEGDEFARLSPIPMSSGCWRGSPC